MTASVGSAMAAAALEWLDALDPDQRHKAALDFDHNDDDGHERLRWFYTPTDHGGLALAEMTASQQRLAHRLLATGLSVGGYNTVALILGQDNILDRLEGFTVNFGRDRGRDPQLFWAAVFGHPGPEGAWSWRFGGHHLSLHFTVIDGRVASTTPCFFGADPAAAPLLGPHLHRPLGGVEDLGRELARSLEGSQRQRGLLTAAPPTDIVTSNRTKPADGDRALPLPVIWRNRFEADIEELLTSMDTRTAESVGLTDRDLAATAFTTAPKGVPARSLDDEQRDLLRSLLGLYVGRIHDDLADREAAKYTGEGLDDLHFLWAGGVETGDPHYYRIQGSRLLVEYDNAQRNGNHVHTVWRDLSADFGGDPLAEHYSSQHHR